MPDNNGCTYDALKLEKQLCFPLYACSREIIKKYRPFLSEIDLTYTQYITMIVLWEYGQISVKELGKKLFLDSGTLTPVLKSLEAKELVTRKRSAEDERVLMVALTASGSILKEKAGDIPSRRGECIGLDKNESAELYRLLYKMLNSKE